jgi:glucose-6-phosphate isomerase
MESVLEFGTKRVKPNIRMLFDMKDVIYDRQWLSDTQNFEVYYMYRELSLSKNDAMAMKENHLRYDITIIPPLMLGCEFVKTAGHYHPEAPGTNETFPEIYEVLTGEAQYLLQKREGEKITDAVLIEAIEGDKVIIPPGYGHITINASNRVLKMANWVSQDFDSIYAPIKEKGGGAYFMLDRGIESNPSYDGIPELRFLKPSSIKELGIQKSKEMYGLVRDMKKLDFLKKPHEYGWVFDEILG